jgi:ubiquinone/menaquinone biosynthesis C-methylase UbiE
VRLFPRIYDLFMAPWEHGRLGRYRHAVVSGVQGRVLEIGAGTGLNFPHYDRAVAVVATDPDVGMLTRAKPRASAAAPNILLVAADAEALPLRDASFDHAVVGLAMCTIPHPDRALGELRRTVRPGGSVRMLEHVRID